MIEHPALTDVYAVLRAHCDDDGIVQLSQAQLGKYSGHSVDVVRGALTLLMDLNVVVRRPRRDMSNGATTYGIHPPEPVPLAPVLQLVRPDDQEGAS